MGGMEETQVVYKTKVVQFLGRSTPIILQNDNGPCPLLAICNVLLLRNIISLSLDTTEISLQRLLSLVAERLLDANSNTENKDDGYVQNQQQNISDAIDLLPRLATGLDVNVRFRNIHDFEFTPECAIFDLLDIGLVHGWIIDPQDEDTARVIGSNSYNTLQERLVALNEKKSQKLKSRDHEEDSVDFAAATTATLGVPSPCLSRGKSFEDSPVSTPREHGGRKGDVEEAEELIKALHISKEDSEDLNLHDFEDSNMSAYLNPYLGSANLLCESSSDLLEPNSQDIDHENSPKEVKKENANVAVGSESTVCFLSSNEVDGSCPKVPGKAHTKQSLSEGTEIDSVKSENFKVAHINKMVELDSQFLFPQSLDVSPEIHSHRSRTDESSAYSDHDKLDEGLGEHESIVCANAISQQGILPSDSKKEPIDGSEDVNSSIEGSEPLYEGEECILVDSSSPMYESREPLYEGEMVLAEQADRAVLQDNVTESLVVSSRQQQEESLSTEDREGELIHHFLRNNASQLTVCGLFCLQEGLKDRELCVFFRNNHFSTMFKFSGDIYLLATDQGYMNQPDLVWEKLNEVHGDTVFMNGNFKEFKAEEQISSSWDQDHAAASTADYIASMKSTERLDATLNSDLQLAIALQQQEFEQQQHQQQRQRPVNSSINAGSKMVTGAQAPASAPKASSSGSKQEAKSKDKCTVM